MLFLLFFTTPNNLHDNSRQSEHVGTFLFPMVNIIWSDHAAKKDRNERQSAAQLVIMPEWLLSDKAPFISLGRMEYLMSDMHINRLTITHYMT